MSQQQCQVTWASHGCDLEAGHERSEVYHQCGQLNSVTGEWDWKCSRIDKADDGLWYRDAFGYLDNGVEPSQTVPQTTVMKDGVFVDVDIS